MSKSAVLTANNVVKTYGRVVALDGADLELFPGEVLAVIGDNGAGKSTLIKCLSGAEVPDNGSIEIDGVSVSFKRPQDGRDAGIETVYQTLAVAPALDIASNLYLGREIRKKGPAGSILRMLDSSGMKKKLRIIFQLLALALFKILVKRLKPYLVDSDKRLLLPALLHLVKK